MRLYMGGSLCLPGHGTASRQRGGGGSNTRKTRQTHGPTSQATSLAAGPFCACPARTARGERNGEAALRTTCFSNTPPPFFQRKTRRPLPPSFGHEDPRPSHNPNYRLCIFFFLSSSSIPTTITTTPRRAEQSSHILVCFRETPGPASFLRLFDLAGSIGFLG